MEWDYETFVGNFSFEGGQFYIWASNQWFPLKDMLIHYGKQGYELISTDYDHAESRLVYIFKRHVGGAPSVGGLPASAAAAPPAGAPPEADDGSSGRRRRSPRDLEKLLREMK